MLKNYIPDLMSDNLDYE